MLNAQCRELRSESLKSFSSSSSFSCKTKMQNSRQKSQAKHLALVFYSKVKFYESTNLGQMIEIYWKYHSLFNCGSYLNVVRVTLSMDTLYI